MHVGMIGLGRMGYNMALRLMRAGHRVTGFDRQPDRFADLEAAGGGVAKTLAELVNAVAKPRIVWLMLPAGAAVDETLDALRGLCAPGDLLVDGGNTYYKDDLRRAELLRAGGLSLLDAGVSGGVWGLQKGYCIMVGGAHDDFLRVQPLLQALAPPEGYLYCGPSGAGHYVKMVHNGIEYAMMEAYGEGFALLDASPYSAQLDFARLAHLWNQGSVIRSWLLELLEPAFARDGRLTSLSGRVEDSGEGRWTVQEAVERGVNAGAIAQALFRRFSSRAPDEFAGRVLAALRQGFGGHAVHAAEKK
jgi:6-phosphogluconate dehydrogenase